MCESVELFIPILPERPLSPNRRAHWAKRVGPTRRLRQFVADWARFAGIKDGLPWPKARLDAELRLCSKGGPELVDYYRPRDEDNAWASLKPAIDGLRDAGVLIDDTAEHLELGSMTLTQVPARDLEGIGFTLTRPPASSRPVSRQ